MIEALGGSGSAPAPVRRRYALRLADETGPRVIRGSEWSTPDVRRTLLCVHAYLSTGREFDQLARVFAGRGWRVVCPDLAGHCTSDPLPPGERYRGRIFRQDLRRLMALLGGDPIDVIGVSLGAILAMRLAAEGAAIRRLVLVDSGPFASREAYRQFAPTVPRTDEYPDLASAVAALELLWSGRDPRPPDEKAALMGTLIRPHGTGFRLRFDPRLLEASADRRDVDGDSWHRWVAVRCPTLVVRGEHSLMMTAETAARMVRLRPGTEVMTVPNCGHRPSLQAPDQIAAVLRWLEAEEAPG